MFLCLNFLTDYSNPILTYKQQNDDMNDKNIEESAENRFLKLYPEYDYSIQSSSKEKDVRKKKKMKTMY